jgi:hypothetical protein
MSRIAYKSKCMRDPYNIRNFAFIFIECNRVNSHYYRKWILGYCSTNFPLKL